MGDHVGQYLTNKERTAMYRKWCRAPGQGGWVEKCPEVREKVLGQRGEQKGPEPPLMLFLAGAQTSDLHKRPARLEFGHPLTGGTNFFKLPGTSSVI